MAFFGMTTLGPQNSFQDAQQNSSMIGVFSADDFVAAYRKVAREFEGDLPADNLREVLESVYHGPVPAADLRRCLSYMPERDPLPLDLFLGAIASAQRDEEEWNQQQGNIVSAAGEFHSSNTFRDNWTKHTRMAKEPRDKYNTPVTGSMAIGWIKPDQYEPRRAKNSCPETVYAAELIKAGVYY